MARSRNHAQAIRRQSRAGDVARCRDRGHG
jgi:hypothetical protein